MEEPLTSQGTNKWYLIADEGDVVMRVDAGMLLGETLAGDLSFAPVDAQLKLDIDADGDLLVSIVDDGESKFEKGSRRSYKRFVRGSRAEISLPHNVLQLDSDFTAKVPADERLQVRARPASPLTPDPASNAPPQGPPPPPGAPARSSSVPPSNQARAPATDDSSLSQSNYANQLSRALLRQQLIESMRQQSLEPKLVDQVSRALLRQQSLESVRQQSLEPKPVEARSLDRPGGQRSARHRRIIAVSVGLLLLVVLGVVGLLWQEPSTREAPVPIASRNVDSGNRPQTSSAEIVVSNEAPVLPELPATVSLAPAIAPAMAPAMAPPMAPPSIGNTPTLSKPSLEPDTETDLVPEPETMAQQTIEPLEDPISELVGTLPLELRSMPQVGQRSAAANPPSGPLITASQPVGRVEPERQLVDTTLRDRAAERILERDLLAAELALEQGRLMTPRQTSAFTLFSRVLATDSNSPQARKGLSSVREALINRAFAQLASASWDDALGTLGVAVDAGANPSLVADLRGEADYGRRLANAQVGRFDELYPFEDLVAISQEPPRMRRYRSATKDPVDVRFTVSGRGDVLDIEILGDPPRGLEQAVRRAVGEWHFEPALFNGRPIPVRTSVSIPIRN